jgi:hypothetical protein
MAASFLFFARHWVRALSVTSLSVLYTAGSISAITLADMVGS